MIPFLAVTRCGYLYCSQEYAKIQIKELLSNYANSGGIDCLDIKALSTQFSVIIKRQPTMIEYAQRRAY